MSDNVTRRLLLRVIVSFKRFLLVKLVKRFVGRFSLVIIIVES